VVGKCRSEYAWAEYPVICDIVLVRFESKELRWMDAQAVPACGGRQSIDGAATPCEPYATCVSLGVPSPGPWCFPAHDHLHAEAPQGSVKAVSCT
jgi:hypothetical protein